MRILLIFLVISTHAFAGYDVHITKRKMWTDDKGPEISLQAWKDFVASDPEMRLDGFAETTTKDGNKLRVESDGLAVWITYSKHGADGNKAWFDWRRGDVVVKNPDREILMKMARVAQKLDARVQGDDGEFYDKNGEQIP